MSTPVFDLDFEEDILVNCIRSVDYLKQAAGVLDSHNFATKHHAWIWQTARGIWDDYKERTTGRLLVARAKADFHREEDREPYLDLAKKLLKRKKGTPKAALAQLELFARKTNAQVMLEEAARLLDKDDKKSIDNVYGIIADLNRRQAKTRTYTSTKWIEEFAQRQADRKHRRDHPEDFKRFPTGFKRIDKILGGGIETGEFGNIMATTGKGKSIVLVNFAYNTIRAGARGLIVGMEMPARQINQRMDSRWLEMPYKKFKMHEFNPAELREIKRQLKRAKKRFKDKLRVVSTPVRSIDINGLVDIIEDQKLDGFNPDVLFLDSADHMVAPKGRKHDNIRTEQAEIYWAIKGMLEEEGYAAWNSIQAGRDWVDEVAKVEAASESYDKGRIADVVISLNTPKKKSRSTREMGGSLDDGDDDDIATRESKITGDYMEAFMAKYRDGESHVVIPMDANFTRMHIDEVDEDKDGE